MTKVKKVVFSFFILVSLSFLVYLYGWQKPKLELAVKKYIEILSEDKAIPFDIKIESIRFSLIPLQVEIYNSQLTPKKILDNNLNSFAISEIHVRPSLLDLIVGKFWIDKLTIKNSTIAINLDSFKKKNSASPNKINFDLNDILKKVPISELEIKNVKLNVNYNNEYQILSKNLNLIAFNEKSSLILSLKEPNLNVTKGNSSDPLNFFIDLQVMITNKTLSISKVKLIKDKSYLIASGYIVHDNNIENIEEIQVQTRVNSKLSNLREWSNRIYRNNHLDNLDGDIKIDVDIAKTKASKNFNIKTNGAIKDLKIDKVELGDIEVHANLKNKKEIYVKKIVANLPGKSQIHINNSSVQLNKDEHTKVSFDTNIHIKRLHLNEFLSQSKITNIPVWLKVNGKINCQGHYKKTLLIDCPGTLTGQGLKVMNGSQSKTIVTAPELKIDGKTTITETSILYQAKIKMKESHGFSSGTIQFDKGFDINYGGNLVDFEEIGPIADLKFLGTSKITGKTHGNSNSATFNMSIDAENFEFEDYYFGSLKTDLNYKSGTLFFKHLKGGIDSTRYDGHLDVNLLKEKITGNIRLPFFRMVDIEQAIIKKVDLQNRFLGSGSGKVNIDTPLDTELMNFILDARLFKGEAFGEEYNEAKLQVEAIDGIIIVQEAHLQKEKTNMHMKGTLDTEMNADLDFSVTNGFLQLSTLVKSNNLPLSGKFNAAGSITKNLSKPEIKVQSKIQQLSFNKEKYGDAQISLHNTDKLTNLQLAIDEKIDLTLVVPEKNESLIFVDLKTVDFDIAPLIGYAISNEPTRNYSIKTTGEVSGRLLENSFWDSEFSSTLEKLSIDYKSNRLSTKLPTSIELKTNKIFLNEIHLEGDKQYIKVIQTSSKHRNTHFTIDSRINIAFFKIFAPFIEKIDGYSKLRLELGINDKHIELFGSSYTTDSYLKFPGFPHAFEKLSADI